MEEYYLHIYNRDDALGLVKMPGNPVDCLRDKVQHQVEVHFIFLEKQDRKKEIIVFKICMIQYKFASLSEQWVHQKLGLKETQAKTACFSQKLN